MKLYNCVRNTKIQWGNLCDFQKFYPSYRSEDNKKWRFTKRQDYNSVAISKIHFNNGNIERLEKFTDKKSNYNLLILGRVEKLVLIQHNRGVV